MKLHCRHRGQRAWGKPAKRRNALRSPGTVAKPKSLRLPDS